MVRGSRSLAFFFFFKQKLSLVYLDLGFSLSVMKLRSKPYYLEVAAHLLQRALEEGHTRLVLKWGKSFFQSLSRSAFITRILVC